MQKILATFHRHNRKPAADTRQIWMNEEIVHGKSKYDVKQLLLMNIRWKTISDRMDVSWMMLLRNLMEDLFHADAVTELRSMRDKFVNSAGYTEYYLQADDYELLGVELQ